MHLSIRTLPTVALLLGASLLVACETYKKAPEEGASTTAAADSDDTTGPGSTRPTPTRDDSPPPAPKQAEPAGGPAGAAEGGASCAAVADNVISVAMSQPNLAPEQLERMKQLEGRQRQVITQTCESTPWPADFRNCLATASAAGEIQACRKFEPKP